MLIDLIQKAMIFSCLHEENMTLLKSYVHVKATYLHICEWNMFTRKQHIYVYVSGICSHEGNIFTYT